MERKGKLRAKAVNFWVGASKKKKIRKKRRNAFKRGWDVVDQKVGKSGADHKNIGRKKLGEGATRGLRLPASSGKNRGSVGGIKVPVEGKRERNSGGGKGPNIEGETEEGDLREKCSQRKEGSGGRKRVVGGLFAKERSQGL